MTGLSPVRRRVLPAFIDSWSKSTTEAGPVDVITVATVGIDDHPPLMVLVVLLNPAWPLMVMVVGAGMGSIAGFTFAGMKPNAMPGRGPHEPSARQTSPAVGQLPWKSGW
jgi:hypothetical protein